MKKTDNTLDFKIDGMTCSTCANTVEKKLDSLEGVSIANVNIATEKGHVVFDSTKIDESKIYAAVSEAGYKAVINKESSIEKVTMRVDNMTCSSCAISIEKILDTLEGVVSANVNFAVEKVTIEYDKNQLRLVDIQNKVSEIGYEIKLESTNEDVDEDEIKIKKAAKKMWISIGLSTLIMIIMVVHMFITPVPGYLAITAILGIPIIFGTGLHVHKGSFKALRNWNPNMDVLVTLGSLPPYLIGLLGFFIPVTTFIEMATTIMTFHLIGKYLEIRAKGRASQAIKKLLEMGAKTAKVIIDGKEVEMPVSDLQVGDIMVVRPGEKVPTDGIIIEGKGLLDESMATGESMPVKRVVGDELIGATINKQGLLKVEVSKIGKDTFLSQVVKMMEECQGSKVPIQEFADRITGYFVPAIMIITLLTFISFNLFPGFHLGIVEWGARFLPWVNPDLSPLTLSFITATAVLVISCPCALGLGTPTALMVGSGMGAEKGILIRNGEAIQTFKSVTAVAFDKTGTITKGKPEVTDIISYNNTSNSDILFYSASVEHGSEHPLSNAIVEKAEIEGIKIDNVKDFEVIVGMGVKGTVKKQNVLIGNRKLMTTNDIEYSTIESDLIKLEEEAKTAMIMALENKIVAVIAVADPIKEESAQAIELLTKMGLTTVMITGDNKRTANAIGRKVGITHVVAEVLPDGKVDEVKRLQEKFGTVAMVGDGINDAPALKQANVGIAIGTGTDIAIEAADVTLVRGELTGIVSAIRLSRAIFRKIKENYFWAWIYNAVFIPIAVIGLLHPLIGAAAMAMSSLNVVYNSLRLKKQDIEPKLVTRSV
ncbi:heavy metal translocating P-type ATPase [Candidatus Xianfuyuplasma coldseepsis]|jgi:Cu+-exporting ATPase|uniref:Copper-exporting P-type ATPase n=1 Tax=Candidatus Xianfuyuplasma coldseepsis TaxID=2782163 RepID=A0A7L7KSP6_9MOLU|nr:heavy metal translocating P-type ATPase [Xianfuyuplasma coldseepsis]QMS85246.1 copper-translocating P-type ATPase [Xianfuyuplasma coldseepsis]